MKDNSDKKKLDEATLSGVGPDDGPSFMYPSHDIYKQATTKDLEKYIETGWSIVSHMIDDDTEEDMMARIYPDGPVGSVSFFPAGDIDDLTPNNQENLFGSEAYDKWKKHTLDTIAKLGWEWIHTRDEDEDAEMAVDDAEDLEGEAEEQHDKEEKQKEKIKEAVEKINGYLDELVISESVKSLGNQDLSQLIDILSHSMEDYNDAEHFIDDLTDKTSYPEDELQTIYDEYWELEPKKRMMYIGKDWQSWLHDNEFKLDRSDEKEDGEDGEEENPDVVDIRSKEDQKMDEINEEYSKGDKVYGKPDYEYQDSGKRAIAVSRTASGGIGAPGRPSGRKEYYGYIVDRNDKVIKPLGKLDKRNFKKDLERKFYKSTINLTGEAISKGFTKAVEKFREEQLKLQKLRDEQKKLVDKFKKSDAKGKKRLKKDLVKMHRAVKKQQEIVDNAERKFNKAVMDEPENLEEAKPAGRRKVVDWIQTFNNAVVDGVRNGYIKFKASDFAMKGIVRELKKMGVDIDLITKFGADEYGINMDDRDNYLDFLTALNKVMESINEGTSDGHISMEGDTVYVDSNFLNKAEGVLPNSQLKHMGMGEFYLDTPDGEIQFIRTNKDINNFVGRAHRMKDDRGGKLIAKLIAPMMRQGKAIKENKENIMNESYPKGKIDAKKLADKMRKVKTMKGLADKIEKKGGKISADELDKMLPDYVPGKHISKLFEIMSEASNKDLQRGDLVNVSSKNKSGVVLKVYGRKIHVRFADGSEKTFNRDEVTFIASENINEADDTGIEYGDRGVVKHIPFDPRHNKSGKSNRAKDVKVNGKKYRYNPTHGTYNSIDGNELLHKSDIKKASGVYRRHKGYHESINEEGNMRDDVKKVVDKVTKAYKVEDDGVLKFRSEKDAEQAYEKLSDAGIAASHSKGQKYGKYVYLESVQSMSLVDLISEKKFYGWYNKEKKEVDASSLYDAKKKLIKKFNIPRSKESMLAVKSAKSMEKGDFRFEGEDLNETVQPSDTMKKILDIVQNKQHQKVDGQDIDLTTAGIIKQVWKKANRSQREKLNKLKAGQLANLAYKMIK